MSVYLNRFTINHNYLKMLKYLLLVTSLLACFQILNVKSAPVVAVSTVIAAAEAVAAAEAAVGIIGDLYVNIAKSGCWPKDIDGDAFLKKDSLSEDDAQWHIHTEIAKDPENTLCERAWWLFYGWSIKCTRKAYHGIDCGSGYHYLEYSRDSYKWRDTLVEEINIKDGRAIEEMEGEKQEDNELYKDVGKYVDKEN